MKSLPSSSACFSVLASAPLLAWLVLGFNVWRQGWKEGTPLSGEEFERNRRRETS